jgi:cytochrome oxidase Cu insertion factor (SCO1/SenC/PrrC family)
MRIWPRARLLAACLLALNMLVGSIGVIHGDTPVDIRTLPLVDQDGHPLSLQALLGQTMVVHAMFTHCVAACHLQVQSLRTVREQLTPEIRARVQFVSVSIDPEHDTPEALRLYAASHGLTDANWHFATVATTMLDQLTRALGVIRKTSPDGVIDHTLVTVLFDAQGRVIQRYSGPVDTARLVREISDVVRLFGNSGKSALP